MIAAPPPPTLAPHAAPPRPPWDEDTDAWDDDEWGEDEPTDDLGSPH